jgi:arabinose operon protein AraL
VDQAADSGGVRRPQRLYAGYAFDLDGTVYLGDTLLPSAQHTIDTLRSAGRPIVFISNNPLRTRADYADKLTRLGIAAAPDDVINSSYVLVQYLRRATPGVNLFVIGESSIQAELREAGFTLTEQVDHIDIVVACFDRTFTYQKLQTAFDAIRAGARFIATNRDAYCPTPDGGLPDCAAIIAAIEACTRHQVEEVVGKPSVIMGRLLAERLGVAPGDCLIAGDRLDTDIAMGIASGMATALVLTGVTTADQAASARPTPDFVVDRLDQLLPEPAS